MAPFLLYLEKPLTNVTTFIIYLAWQFGLTELNSTFDLNRRSFNFLKSTETVIGFGSCEVRRLPEP